jgi:uncharacterized repeat protein (TIGR03943 family)
MNKIFNYAKIFLFSLYVFLLFVSGNINYYIHPRYEVFTAVLSFVALIFSGLSLAKLALDLSKNKIKLSINKKSLAFTAIIFIPIIFGYTLQAQPLSSVTAQQRSADFNSLNLDIDTVEQSPFTLDTTTYDLGEWIVALNNEPDLFKFQESKVDLDGFVFYSQNFSEDYFLLSRFSITCCAVDARPVGLPVDISDLEEAPEEDTWLRVTGEIDVREIDQEKQLVIVPDSIEEVDVPSDPYIF